MLIHLFFRPRPTQILYGDFTHEAGTMTTFVSPELTMRQLRRLPAARGLAPESCGRVYSRLKDPGWEDVRHKRLGCVRPYHVCDQPVRDCGKTWKQGPGAPPLTDGCGPPCGAQSRAGAGSCDISSLLKFPTNRIPLRM